MNTSAGNGGARGAAAVSRAPGADAVSRDALPGTSGPLTGPLAHMVPRDAAGIPRNTRVLVLGGSGMVGRSVCEQLFVRAGGVGRIVVPTRHPARARHLKLLPTAEIPEADIHDDAALARLLGGCDAVVNLVGVLHASAAEFERVHAALPQRLARLAPAAGIERIVHLSALGASADAPSLYLRSKAAGEAALQGSGATILRPAAIFGEDDRFLNRLAGAQALLPVLPLAAPDAKLQPVWVEDVGRAVARALDDRAAPGQIYECCGPDVYTLRQLAELAGRWAGHPRPVLGLSPALGRLQARLLEWMPGTPPLSRDALATLGTAQVASGALPGLAELGITPASLQSIAPLYLGGESGPGRFDAWRAEATRG